MKEIIILRKLYAEIRKWENQRGMTSSTIMKLLKLYIGMGVDKLMDKEGKIHCQYFNKMATVLHCRNPRELIDKIVNSGSFKYERCNNSNMNIYGVMWIAPSLFYNSEAASKPTSETASKPTSEAALKTASETPQKLTSETPQKLTSNSPKTDQFSPKPESNSGEFHLINKYIKDLSNIPSGGIACTHASDSSGVAQSVPQKVSPMVNNLLRNPEVMKKMYHSIIEVLDKCINRHSDLAARRHGASTRLTRVLLPRHQLRSAVKALLR